METINERIIEFATKVVNNPKGSNTYDPADMLILEYYIRKKEAKLLDYNI